jgi:predicted DNA-binding protein (MmcQ/YjbR family)
MTAKQTLARLRKVCLALPDATEVVAWDHPTFRIRNKIFCVYGGYADAPNITLKVGKPALGIFLEDPRFWKASHIGNQGWISMSAKGDLNWEELEELIKGSYQMIAPKVIARRGSVKNAESKSPSGKRSGSARAGAASRTKPKRVK